MAFPDPSDKQTQMTNPVANGPVAQNGTVTSPLTKYQQPSVGAGANVVDPSGVVGVDPALASKNTKLTFVELPLQSYVMWDAFTLVNQALADHENGLFRSSSLLVDAFGRDDRYSATSSTRLNTVFSLPLSFEPSKTTNPSKSKKIADDLSNGNLFQSMFPQEELRKLLKWGLMCGVGLGELVWDNWKPRLRAWHPQYLYWDWSTYRFYVATTKGIVPVTPGDGKWILYTPYGMKYGWMEGLVRSIAALWFYRKFNYRDWARYNEVHGLPIRKAITPADAKVEHQDRFAREMAALGSEGIVTLAQNGKDQPGFDLQLLEAKADTYGAFVQFMAQLDNSMAIVVLGQNLTTSVTGGSYAATKAHDSVRSDLKTADATTMANCLREQALVHYVAFNYDMGAAADITPMPTWETEPPEDKGSRATAIQALALAMASFRANGANLDWRKLFLDFGLPVIGNGIDPTIKTPGQLQADASAAMAAAGGNGGDNGPPRPGQKKKGGLDDAIKNAIMELRDSRTPGWQRGQEYADIVSAHAIGEGARIIGKDVAVLLRLIRQSTTPDELKKSLLTTFGNMDPTQLAKLNAKVGILARMDGQVSVLEDL